MARQRGEPTTYEGDVIDILLEHLNRLSRVEEPHHTLSEIEVRGSGQARSQQ